MEIAECNSGINIVGTFMIFHTMACTYFVLASILCVLFLDPVVTLQKKVSNCMENAECNSGINIKLVLFNAL